MRLEMNEAEPTTEIESNENKTNETERNESNLLERGAKKIARSLKMG